MKKAGYKVAIEKSHSEEAPYRTSLVAKQGQLTKLIEAQGDLNFHREQNFAHWLAAERQYVELYIATSEDTAVPAVVLAGGKEGAAWVC